MACTVWALFGSLLGSGLWGMARGMFRVVCRGGDGDRRVRMAGRQTRLCAVQQKGEEDDHCRQSLA